MPDLDGQLAELREDLYGMVRQPDVAAVIERSRQAGARRRTQFAAAAAVLVVGAAIPLLRTTLGPVGTDPVTPQTAVTTTTTTPAPTSPYRYDVDFADARHGFATRWLCGSPLIAANCSSGFLASDDGGQHWQPRTIPVELSPSKPPRIFVFDQRRVAIGTYSLDGSDDQRFYTSDAGVTWTPVAAAGSDTAAMIPDGGLLDVACTVSGPECDSVLAVVAPDSGRMLPLAAKPPLTNPLPGSIIPLAGGWWVTGKDPATGRPALAVSRDGRTWSVRPLPDAPETMSYALMTAHGTTLYAAAGGNNQDSGPNLVAIFRSTNGGTTWERTFLAGADRVPRYLFGYPAAGADGRLILGGQGSAWVSRDGGRTFELLPSADVNGIIRPTRGGYLASPSLGMSNVYKFSTDGVRWKEITVG